MNASECAIYIDDSIVLAGSSFRCKTPTKIETYLWAPKNANSSTWVGFRLDIPENNANQFDNEKDGFGLCKQYHTTEGKVVVCPKRSLMVRLPRGEFDVVANKAVLPEHLSLVPTGSKLSVVTLTLHKGAKCEVRGLGVPYQNIGDRDLDAIVNIDKAFYRGLSLMDIFARGTKFKLLVMQNATAVERASVPGPLFTYSYGDDHVWDLVKFKKLLVASASKKAFTKSYQFDDNNAMVTVCVHACIQDVLWLDNTAKVIEKLRKWDAYFVRNPEERDSYYVIVPTTQEFRKMYNSALERLTKDDRVVLLMPTGGGKPLELECIIVTHVHDIEALRPHRTDQWEMVLETKVPQESPACSLLKTYPSRPVVNQQRNGDPTA
ncbi:hypothetical protein B0T11DRAFT_344038 [Plectosphaerella cucumerina]|uniref:Uncharacterized protein n=1 Tax=Plectosphaerella cucumerina TaxID=40658 RepID=A0A8K0TTS5_9PEZI|nr:hypothetical protein B0T11DRAFT_344038 [Plectosphaerella cucumerina]